MDNQMQVVFSASRNLYPYITAGIHSLIANNPNCKVWLFLEDDEVPYALPEQCEIVNVAGQTFFGADCANIRTTYTYMSLMRATYAKLFTGEPNGYGIRTLPKLDKIVQMDVDVVIRGSLQPLWDVDMDGKWFFMTHEALGAYKPFGKSEPFYYNCGVCVFNLAQMREDGIVDEAIELLNKNKWMCIDQDCWNYLLKKYGYDKCLPMGAKYNSTTLTGSAGPDRDVVIHYAGERHWMRNFDEVYRGRYMKEWSKVFEYEACKKAGLVK